MVNRCVRCGTLFESKRKTAVCDNCHTAVCVVCGNEFELKWPYTAVACSSKCRGIYRKESGAGKQVAEKAKATLQAKYGVDNASALMKFTKICKACGKSFETTSPRQEYCNDVHYGPCPVCGKLTAIKEMYLGPQACSKKCRQERIQQTCLTKYGTTTSVNSAQAREKSRQTCLDKYGAPHYSKTQEYRDKYIATMLDRYGTTVPLKNDEVLSKLRETCLAKYGVEYNCMRPACRSAHHTISKINQQFSALLTQNNIEHEFEFALSRYSYDFKVGHVLIEIDPSITHNSHLSIFPDCNPIDLTYHINKTKLAQDNGYRCIHVWDWDNWSKVIELLRPTQSIGARKCEIREVSQKAANAFTAEYHINGSCNGQICNYGLYFEDELVEIMTFGKPRYNKRYDWELLRLCTRSQIRVPGGASRLFHYFIQLHQGSIISYCDLSKFTGTVYSKIGMKLVNITSPNKIWSRGDKKITQNLLNQRGYDQLFGTDFGKGTSNEQLMLDNGWLPVYDCGQLVFEYVPGTRA